MSQQQFPGPYPPPPYSPPRPPVKRDNKVLWIVLGSVFGFFIMVGLGIFAIMSTLVANEHKAVDKMESIASRIVPADDWTERSLRKPKVDPGCLPIDTTCHRWEQSWATSGDVSLGDIEDQLGIPLNDASSPNCRVGTDGDVRVEVCAFNDEDPQFNLFMQD